MRSEHSPTEARQGRRRVRARVNCRQVQLSALEDKRDLCSNSHTEKNDTPRHIVTVGSH